jgi:hypothetical protein
VESLPRLRNRCAKRHFCANFTLMVITYQDRLGTNTGNVEGKEACFAGGQSLPDEPGWAEFVVRKPSVVGTDENGDAIETNHYSQSVRMGCYNQVFVKR